MIEVTNGNNPPVEDNSIIVMQPYDAIPTPSGRLKEGVYYSWKGKWLNMWDKFIPYVSLMLAGLVPKSRTITINGDTKDLSEDRSWTVGGTSYISSVSNTNTVELDVTANDLTANVQYQNTSTINISDNASGLKADFASMDISQFINDSGYLTSADITGERRNDWNSPYNYCGSAPIGSATSSNVWTIYRIQVAGDGSTTVKSATSVSWDDRYIVIYT